MDERATSYGSAEVARAAGVERGIFDSWLLRKYLPLPAGPGTGRAREYSLLDAVRVAAMANLVFTGVSPGRAGNYVAAIERVPQPGDTLVIAYDPINGQSLAGVLYPPGDGGATLDAIREFASRIVLHDSAGARIRPPGTYQLDLQELLTQVQRGLDDPAWRPDLAAVDTRQHEAVFVLRMTPPEQPSPKRRTRKAKAK